MQAQSMVVKGASRHPVGGGLRLLVMIVRDLIYWGSIEMAKRRLCLNARCQGRLSIHSISRFRRDRNVGGRTCHELKYEHPHLFQFTCFLLETLACCGCPPYSDFPDQSVFNGPRAWRG